MGVFDNGPVICHRLSHNGFSAGLLDLGVVSGQYNLPCMGHYGEPWTYNRSINNNNNVNESERNRKSCQRTSPLS